MTFILFALAIAPGLAIAIFVYEKDKLDKEPLHLLAKSFFLGIAGVLLAIVLQEGGSFLYGFFGQLLGWNMGQGIPGTFGYALSVGFTEEWSKYLLLMWFAIPERSSTNLLMALPTR